MVSNEKPRSPGPRLISETACELEMIQVSSMGIYLLGCEDKKVAGSTWIAGDVEAAIYRASDSVIIPIGGVRELIVDWFSSRVKYPRKSAVICCGYVERIIDATCLQVAALLAACHENGDWVSNHSMLCHLIGPPTLLSTSEDQIPGAVKAGRANTGQQADRDWSLTARHSTGSE